jgi:hypothetical protein
LIFHRSLDSIFSQPEVLQLLNAVTPIEHANPYRAAKDSLRKIIPCSNI